MSRAGRVAEKVAARFGRDPWLVADGLGLPVYEIPLPGKYREVYLAARGGDGAQAIVVSPDASNAEARELVAHGLGHHLLHAGNRLAAGGRLAAWFRANEREADDFAACLLVPGNALRQRLSEIDPVGLPDLAEVFDVNEELVARRIALLERIAGPT